MQERLGGTMLRGVLELRARGFAAGDVGHTKSSLEEK
jgi:hypothetical protein